MDKSKLTRIPYQPPQTSMERHVEELVSHLRNNVDSRSGFAQAVENAMDHAFWLETTCRRLQEDNDELERALCLPLPKITADGKFEPAELNYIEMDRFDWRMNSIVWRVNLNPSQGRADHKTWTRIRKITYKKILKQFRKAFVDTFPACSPQGK